MNRGLAILLLTGLGLLSTGNRVAADAIVVTRAMLASTIAEIFIEENHFFISGSTLQKLGERVYAADEATVTACEGEIPDWKITGKNLKVDSDGVGVVARTGTPNS